MRAIGLLGPFNSPLTSDLAKMIQTSALPAQDNAPTPCTTFWPGDFYVRDYNDIYVSADCRGREFHARLIKGELMVKVKTSECKHAESPQILYSGGIGTDIAIGIFDPKTGSGHMIRVPTFVLYRGRPPIDTLQEIRESYSDTSSLKIVAAGAELTTDEFSVSLHDRCHCLSALKTLFLGAAIKTRWMDTGINSSLYLDLSNGTFSVSEMGDK